MSMLSLSALSRSTSALLRRFGLIAYMEFLALGVAITTLKVLLTPERFRAEVSGAPPDNVLAILTDPYVLAHETVYAILFGAACLRIWAAMEPDGWAGQEIRAVAVPLVLLNLLTGYAAYLGILFLLVPGLFVAALCTALTPAILIEGRGWDGLRRSVELTRFAVFRLSLAWGAVLVPALVLLVVATPAPDLEGARSLSDLWLAWLMPEVVSAALSTVSLCLVMAAYGMLIQSESGGSPRQLDDIFR